LNSVVPRCQAGGAAKRTVTSYIMKVTFIDNSNSQYDSSATELTGKIDGLTSTGRLWIGDRDAASLLQLKHRQVTHVINCEKDIHGTSKEKDIVYLNIDPEEDSGTLEKAYTFLEKELSSSSRVLVHCLTGNGRSCGILLFYLMKKLNLSLANAHRRLSGLRSRLQLRSQLVNTLLLQEKKLRPNLPPSVELNEKRQIVYIDGGDTPFGNNSSGNSSSNAAAAAAAAAKGKTRRGALWGMVSIVVLIAVIYFSFDWFISASAVPSTNRASAAKKPNNNKSNKSGAKRRSTERK